MNIKNVFNQIRKGEISTIEVITDILRKTEEKPERVKWYLDEVESYLLMNESGLSIQFSEFLKRVFNENLTLKNKEDLNLTFWQSLTIDICREYGYKSMLDVIKEERLSLNHPFRVAIIELLMEYEKDNPINGYVEPSNEMYFELYELYFLRDTLKKYIEPKQESQESPTKKQAKNIWGLLTRFEFLKDLQIIENIQQSVEKREDQNLILMQILGCSFDNAKKLINGTYQTSEVDTEQLERKQLIGKIKQDQMR